jgi:universal stress protein A
MKRFRRILHPSDFSPASGPAFARALEMAKLNRAELLIVHVLTPAATMMGDGYISPQVYDQLQRSIQTAAQRRIEALVRRARKAGLRVRTQLIEGSPSEAIVRAARAKRADLIAMGTHGRGGVAKLFLGSVAERVVGTAPCPVLTVRGR